MSVKVGDSSRHKDRSLSKPFSKCWPLINWVTSVPKFLKIEANSQAIYPPPTINIDLGNFSNSKISSLVQAKSIPGIFSFFGLPPTEIRIFFELILFLIFSVFGQIISNSFLVVNLPKPVSYTHLTLPTIYSV